MNPTDNHQNFIDWMKASGMLLIVIGHILGSATNPFNDIFQPVYTKQFGVAFFVFVTGWSLTNDQRPRLQVVFNRILPVYLYGFAFAFILSCIFIFTKNDINESNYMPFIFGVNVLVNYFPANPTTWYIGTYLHLLLFWFLFFHNRRVTRHHLLIAFVIENLVRFTLISIDKDFIAYMLLPNWLTVFLLGMYLHKRKDIDPDKRSILQVVFLVLLAVLSNYAIHFLSFDKSFPFRELGHSEISATLLQSLLISYNYILYTLIAFSIFRLLPFSRTVSFFSRNTLVIFILHMPVIYELSPYLYNQIDSIFVKKLTIIILLYVGIAWLSEILHKFIDIRPLKRHSWSLIARLTNHSPK